MISMSNTQFIVHSTTPLHTKMIYVGSLGYSLNMIYGNICVRRFSYVCLTVLEIQSFFITLLGKSDSIVSLHTERKCISSVGCSLEMMLRYMPKSLFVYFCHIDWSITIIIVSLFLNISYTVHTSRNYWCNFGIIVQCITNLGKIHFSPCSIYMFVSFDLRM